MRGVSRRPSPVTARPSRPRRASVIAAVLLGAGLIAGPGGPARAAGTDASTVIDRTFIDAAFVDRPGNETPDLLTIALDESTFGLVHIALLRRETAWTIQAQVAADLSASFDGGTPWLVQLGPGSFEIIAGTNDQGTVVTHVQVAAGALAVDPPTVLALSTTDAGAADVTGDGAPDLVLAGYLGAGTTDCPPAALAAISGQDSTLAFLHPLQLPGVTNKVRLAGAALGEWDDVPGIDLLANVFETCVSVLDNVEPHHLTVIRLNDGAVVADHLTPVPEMLTASPWPSKPLVLDVDGDGRNEALIATEAGLQIVDPSDGFRSVPIPGLRAVPIAARSTPGAPGMSVSWLDSTGDASHESFGTARVVRVDGRIQVAQRSVQPFPEGSASDARDAALSLENAAYSQQPLYAPLGDIDADGCADIVIPLAWIGCGSEPRPGPSWLATRPLGLVGPSSDRRVLVAAGLDWFPYSGGGGSVPSPAAAAPAGAWRSGASGRFVLVEVPLSAITSGSSIAVGQPQIGRTASQDGVIELRWPPGTHLLVRAAPVTETIPATHSSSLTTRAGFLHTDVPDGEFSGLVIPDDSGGAGGTPSSTSWRFDLLGNVRTPEGASVESWIVTAAALDATGALSDPVQASASIDRVAPSASLDAPPLSLPWPFGTSLHGRTEAGASVSLPGASPVVVGPDGAFELPTQLAPWPQAIEVSVTDPAGNVGLAHVTAMGGADLQGVPWPAIGALLVLIGAGLSSVRGVRRRRPTVGGVNPVNPTAAPDGDHVAVIEELSSGRIGSRD
jgi:hypothetical protein